MHRVVIDGTPGLESIEVDGRRLSCTAVQVRMVMGQAPRVTLTFPADVQLVLPAAAVSPERLP